MIIKTILWRVIRQIIVVVLFISIPCVVAATWLEGEIFSPPRRLLQPYHLDYLNHPKQHGLRIRQYACLDNQAPCLLVEPTQQAGRRGKILRRQLAQKGLRLADYGTTRGIIVLLHGRHGRKEDLLPVAERFVAAGFRCLIPDLPAHGESPLTSMSFGSSAFERSLARRALDDVREAFKLPKEPAILWGMSMGGAFALSAANEAPDYWDALLVVSSFAQLNDVLDQQMPRKYKVALPAIHFFLDIAQFLQRQPQLSEMAPQKWAKKVMLPTLIVHGEKDYFVPLSQGKSLYKAVFSQNKHWISVPRGGHMNVLATPMKLYAEMSAWLIQSLKLRNNHET